MSAVSSAPGYNITSIASQFIQAKEYGIYAFFSNRLDAPAQCDPPCVNGATCILGVLCTCPVGYYGRQCENSWII